MSEYKFQAELGRAQNLYTVSVNTSCYPEKIFVCVQEVEYKTLQHIFAVLPDSIDRASDLIQRVEILNKLFGKFKQMHIFFEYSGEVYGRYLGGRSEYWSYQRAGWGYRQDNHPSAMDINLILRDMCIPADVHEWIKKHI